MGHPDGDQILDYLSNSEPTHEPLHLHWEAAVCLPFPVSHFPLLISFLLRYVFKGWKIGAELELKAVQPAVTEIY